MALSHSSAVFVVTVFAQDGRVDVSDSIASMLRECGARIEPRVTSRTTHLVFRRGDFSLLAAARASSAKIECVKPSYVLESIDARALVSIEPRHRVADSLTRSDELLFGIATTAERIAAARERKATTATFEVAASAADLRVPSAFSSSQREPIAVPESDSGSDSEEALPSAALGVTSFVPRAAAAAAAAAPRRRKASASWPAKGLAVRVHWPEENAWFLGRVAQWDAADRTHKIVYDDGDVQWHDLTDVVWKCAVGVAGGNAAPLPQEQRPPAQQVTELQSKRSSPHQEAAGRDAKRARTSRRRGGGGAQLAESAARLAEALSMPIAAVTIALKLCDGHVDNALQRLLAPQASAAIAEARERRHRARGSL